MDESIILQAIQALGDRLTGIENRITSIENRLTSMDEAISYKFSQIDERFDRLEQKVDKGFAEIRTGLNILNESQFKHEVEIAMLKKRMEFPA